MLSLSCLSVILTAVLVQGYDNGAAHSRLPIMGWSSWVALAPLGEHPIFDYCDTDSIKATADAFMELGFPKHNYKHFHLDDCWADPERNATDFLQPNRAHFKNGIKEVIDYIHDYDLSFGLYTYAGTHTCVGGLPGSKDHWEQDANVFAEWGSGLREDG